MVTHEQWQEQVVQLATMLGWRHMHVRRSIGAHRRWTTATNVTGWPDLWLWSERRRAFAALELKVGHDRATAEQVAVLASLRAAGARTMIAYPADADALRAMLEEV